MYSYRNTEDTLLKFKKILAFLTSLGMAGISVWFSQKGFGIESSDKLLWIGWFLGITVNVIEMVFNTNIRNLNPTLIAAGIVAYTYGLYTNVVGFHGIMNSWAFSAIVGIFVEVLPEPLFAWSIGVVDGGDLVGNIAELFGGPPIRSNARHSNQPIGFHRPEPYKPTTQKPIKKNKMHRFPQESLMNQTPLDGRLKSRLFDDNYIKHQVKRKK